MDLRQHCRQMANYHGWAFARLHAEVDALSEHDYRRDTGLFFGSIHATLNHLLLADCIWHGRLVERPFPATSLRDEVEPDRAALRQRLLARGTLWLAYIDALDDATLAGTAHFTRLDGATASLARATCVLHVFNHGTHHRGQISTALTQLGRKAPEMDLPYQVFGLG